MSMLYRMNPLVEVDREVGWDIAHRVRVDEPGHEVLLAELDDEVAPDDDESGEASGDVREPDDAAAGRTSPCRCSVFAHPGSLFAQARKFGNGIPRPAARRGAVASGRCDLVEQAPGDDDSLDLVRALVDLGDLGIPHHALDREVPRVAGAPEELDGIGGHAHGRVRREQLRHGGLLRGLLTGVDAGRGRVHEEPGRLELRGEVGDHELDAFEVGDPLVELLALGHVTDREIKCPLGDSDCLRPDDRSGPVEGVHRVIEPATFLADQVLGRYRNVVEDDLSGRRTADSQLLLELADGEARRVVLDDERADPAVTCLRVRLGEDCVQLGDARVRDPHLAAGEDVSIAVSNGSRLHRGNVAAGVGLGEAVARLQLAACHSRHVPALELLGAITKKSPDPETGDQHAQRSRRADARELFDHDCVGEQRAVFTAVLRRVQR